MRGNAHSVGAVGARLPRLDGAQFVTGQARYTTDVHLPGMLYCRLVYAPQAPGRIVHLQIAEASRLPGVKAVLTGTDLAHVHNVGLCFRDRPLMARTIVRSPADVIAAVAAVDDRTAQEAAALIDAAVEPVEAVFAPQDALRTTAPVVHEAKSTVAVAPYIKPYRDVGRNNVSTDFSVLRGDVETARRSAAVVVRDRFTTQRMEHFSMEPHAAVVDFDRTSGRFTVWSSTGKPFRTLAQFASTLGIAVNRVNFIHLPAGGDFGGKGELTVEPFCALLAIRTGRPVKGVYTRREEFLASTCKVPFDIDLEMGFDARGRIAFVDGDIVVDCGAYNSMASLVAIHGATHLEGPYNVPNVRVRARAVYTHNILSGSFRGFGSEQVTFARESLIDEAATRLRTDPLAVRLMNAWEPGSVTCTGQVLDPARLSVSVKDTLAAAAEAAGWTAAKASAPPAAGRWKRGIGMAAGHHGIGLAIWFGADTGTTFVKANTDGSITLITGAAEVGQSASTALTQIVAEELGVPATSIALAPRETDTVPYDGGASASRTIYVVGNATRAAAIDLRGKLADIAGRMLEADPHDIECRGGRLFVRGVQKHAVGFGEVVAYSMRTVGDLPFGIGTFNKAVETLDEHGRGSPFLTFDYATQIAEVEVDTETGEVRVTKLLSAQDVGRAINPMIVEGQIEGAMVMGMGYALTEEIVCEQGQVRNGQALEYSVPHALSLPDLATTILEKADPVGPYGAKGVGEMGLVPTAAAISNAIYDAIGARVSTLPITPEKVLLAQRRLHASETHSDGRRG